MSFDRDHVAQEEQPQQPDDDGEHDRPNGIPLSAFNALVVRCPSIPWAAYRAIYVHDVQEGGYTLCIWRGPCKEAFFDVRFCIAWACTCVLPKTGDQTFLPLKAKVLKGLLAAPSFWVDILPTASCVLNVWTPSVYLTIIPASFTLFVHIEANISPTLEKFLLRRKVKGVIFEFLGNGFKPTAKDTTKSALDFQSGCAIPASIASVLANMFSMRV